MNWTAELALLLDANIVLNSKALRTCDWRNFGFGSAHALDLRNRLSVMTFLREGDADVTFAFFGYDVLLFGKNSYNLFYIAGENAMDCYGGHKQKELFDRSI
ncbi:uncharacterized protein PHALS_06143 [Plasmopara halstedii]|uniref:Uncharacterized protein n=1 Tax=Plasmopara halstedii TaxID=4781 RepID=A0A0N7L7X8_PLAHL|nr:uncharacterized protein PHALS_06143 [Plasmopara halstedii]CEG48315.1 hypothetical protein PHALS_06143 [Plasmopara halstedii]|eukprot:XP_024584684.1 hypothetical protein PHALS_06143 [Plasmopara halstedii]